MSDDGALFVVGGKVDGGPSRAGARFDRAAGTWSAVESMPVAVEGGMAVRLGPNRVALVGGTRNEAAGTKHDLLATTKDSKLSWSVAPWARAIGTGENGACAAVWV